MSKILNGILDIVLTLFSDDVLNKAIAAMRKQREDDLRSKDGLMSDKARLEALINQLQARIADLEAKVRPTDFMT